MEKAQKQTIILLTGYSIDQLKQDVKTTGMIKSQLQLELTAYSNDFSTEKYESFMRDLVEFIEERNDKALAEDTEDLGTQNETVNEQLEAELTIKITRLLADNNLTIKQAANLLDKVKLQLMHHTKLSHNFDDLIKEAVILEQIHQEVNY